MQNITTEGANIKQKTKHAKTQNLNEPKSDKNRNKQKYKIN